MLFINFLWKENKLSQQIEKDITLLNKFVKTLTYRGYFTVCANL